MPNNFDRQLISHYDELMKAWPHADEFRSRGAELIRAYISDNPKDHYRAFEIGSGRGELTKSVLEIDKRITILACELSPAMIQAAKDNLKDYKDQHQVMPVDGFLLADQLCDFDIFMSCWTLHNLRERTKPFLSKVYQLLNPNGFFINLDKYVPWGPEQNTLLKEHFERLQMLHPALRKTALQHEKEDLNPRYWQTESDLDLMRTIGFKNVQIHNRYGLDAIVTAYK
jgi:SAM-dependent methyltransferase